MKPLTVAVCSRNPPTERLERVLEALGKQTLARDEWRLLLVDNGSEPALDSLVDISRFSGARIIREPLAGLTSARLAAIRESDGHLVFVDDDNLLRPDYLETCIHHLRDSPEVGAFGGSIELQFEEPPLEWTRMFHGMFAERIIRQDVHGSAHVGNPAVPCGAGMVVRREVADAYSRLVKDDPRRRAMDRGPGSLISDGDTDLALTACDLGLACGQFADLKLTHIIPKARCTVDYLERLAHGMAYSGVILRSLRDETRSELKAPRRYEQLRGFWQELWLTNEQRRVRHAWARGRDEALAAVNDSSPDRLKKHWNRHI